MTSNVSSLQNPVQFQQDQTTHHSTSTSERPVGKILNGEEALQTEMSRVANKASDCLSRLASSLKLDGRNPSEQNHIQKIQEIEALEENPGAGIVKKAITKLGNIHIAILQGGDKAAAAVGEITYAATLSALNFILPGRVGTIAAKILAITVGLIARSALFLISQLAHLVVAGLATAATLAVTGVVTGGASALVGLALGTAPFWIAAAVVYVKLNKEIQDLKGQNGQMQGSLGRIEQAVVSNTSSVSSEYEEEGEPLPSANSATITTSTPEEA